MNNLLQRMGIHMPSFNKGIYRGILKYEAKPSRKFGTICKLLRWYRPYAPGQKLDFKLTLQSLDGSNNNVRLYPYNNSKIHDVKEIHYTPQKVEHKILGLVVPGQGSLDYRFGTSEEEDSVIVVSTVATHNDTWTVLAAGGIITFLCTILSIAITWLLSFIGIIPKWDMWMPDFIVEFLKRMIE